MRSLRHVLLLSILVLAASTPSPLVDAAESDPRFGSATNESIPHATDHVLVRLEPDAAAVSALGDHIPVYGRWVEVPVPQGSTPAESLELIADLEGVDLVELDYQIQLDPVAGTASGLSAEIGGPVSVVPNDTFYPLQWHMPKIQAEQAWDISKGDGALVAVIDTGVSQGGVDLDCHTFVSPFNAVTNTPGPASDDNGHGTHVAGTIAQCTDNGIGVAGVAHEANLIPIKVCDSGGNCTWSDVAQGIDWARTHGADVINLSLGGSFGASILEEAVANALAADIVVAAASGNDGNESVDFPAAYPGVIAVGALDFNLDLAYYSQYGPEQDITAPGGDVTVDLSGDTYADGVLQETFDGPTWGYHFFQGTSMATPHVAGAAALLRSQEPAAPRGHVADALTASAMDRGAPGWDPSFGHGSLRARSALDYLTAPPTWPAGAAITAHDITPEAMVLEWPAARDDQGIDEYWVYRDGDLIGTTGAGQRSLAVSGLQSDAKYQFAVRAFDDLGYQSPLLEDALKTITSPPVWPAEGALVADDITTASLILSWPKALDDKAVTGYRVYRDGAEIDRLVPSTRRLMVTGLSPDTSYRFAVQAFDAIGRSELLTTRATTLSDACTTSRFDDVRCDHLFWDDVDWLAKERITIGCNPPLNSLFCPDDSVSRGEMAAFLTRGLSLPTSDDDVFTDDNGNVFESDIQALAASGITHGCNPPTNDHYCPSDPVSRGEMAAFLTRGLSLPTSTDDVFTDDNGNVFESDIQALAASGITHGCNPPTNDHYCPGDPVTREQMAAFLRRGLGR